MTGKEFINSLANGKSDIIPYYRKISTPYAISAAKYSVRV